MAGEYSFGTTFGQIGSRSDPTNPSLPVFGVVGGPDANQMQLLNRELYDPGHWQRERAMGDLALGDAQFKSGQQKQLWGALFPQIKNAFGGDSFVGKLYNNPFTIPAPNYLTPSPVWSQGQIDAQSNLQRANLQQQAAVQSRDFANKMGSRGFSPLSPLSDFMANNNNMKANAAAAANETQLNFGAAQANSDARLKAAQVNAGMWGDWVRNLVEGQKIYQADISSQRDYNLQRQNMMLGLLGKLF